MNPIKHVYTKTPNQENIVSFFSQKKKSNYNLHQLFNAINIELRKLNIGNYCHLSTYPYIGVHVENRNSKYLIDNKDEIEHVIQKILWEWHA